MTQSLLEPESTSVRIRRASAPPRSQRPLDFAAPAGDDRPEATPMARESTHAVVGWARAFGRNLAVQDYLFFGYFAVFFVALVFGSGPHRTTELGRVCLDLAILFAGLAIARGGILPNETRLGSTIYRFTIFGVVSLSYFQLQHILPAVSSRSMDAAIYSLDQRLFGIEPALVWDRFVTPSTTEWFAFFYFGYFALLGAHVLPYLLVSRDRDMTARFSLGIYLVFCTAHILYMVVPGFGPYRFLASEFRHELSGGVFWRLVVEAVTGAGAQKDIFPSLHTAAPTFFTLFSYRHRDRLPFKYTWPFVGFFASQIIVATMFLRWHYLIDICAGVTLASVALVVSDRLANWERERRARLGLSPTFGPAPIALPLPAPASLPARDG